MGKTPHYNCTRDKLLHTIINKDVPEITGNWSDAFKDFVSRCLKRNPAERSDIHAVLGHPFLVGLEEDT